jgi:hypothetical protein
MLVLSAVQVGSTFKDYLTVTDAARVGARRAIASRLAPDPRAATVAAVQKAAVDLDPTKLGVQVVSTFKQGDDVTVTTTYPYDINILGLVVKAGSLTSTITERVE